MFLLIDFVRLFLNKFHISFTILFTKQKANILNEQFKSVFTTESIDNIPNKDVSPHPDIPPLTITTPGIRKLLDNINPHTASGPDNISGRILKYLQNFTAPILTIIFQKSLQTGCIPTDWKHANVAPAYKSSYVLQDFSCLLL
jgi:hypothetical protein